MSHIFSLSRFELSSQVMLASWPGSGQIEESKDKQASASLEGWLEDVIHLSTWTSANAL